MNCEEARTCLEGGTSPAEDAAVAEHLRQCKDCAAYAARLEPEDAALRQALAQQPGEARWQDVKSRLASRLDREALSRSRRVFWAVASAAALIAFALTAFVMRRVVQPEPAESLAENVTTLQEEVRAKQVLDELEQLQIAFRNVGDADGCSVSEDAELYVERILALDAKRGDEAREILAGIKTSGIHKRLQRVRETISDDAPAPLRASLDLAASTLTKAARIADSRGKRHGR